MRRDREIKKERQREKSNQKRLREQTPQCNE